MTNFIVLKFHIQLVCEDFVHLFFFFVFPDKLQMPTIVSLSPPCGVVYSELILSISRSQRIGLGDWGLLLSNIGGLYLAPVRYSHERA